LRFPEFTGEWKMATFGDIAKGFDYGMNAAAKSFDGNNKYIRITDIDEVSSQYLYDDVVSPDGELEDRYLVKENDILLARTGASTGKSYLYRNSDGKLYFAGFLIRANIYKHNSYFVFSQLHTLRYKKWISVMSARSGQPGINSQEYASFPVYTTSLQEEDKIATFLKLLDERITTQNKIIEDLKKLKSAIIEMEYTHKTKSNSHIGDFIEQTSKRNKNRAIQNVLSVSNRQGFIQQSEQFENRSVASDDTSSYKIVKNNNFAFNPARINVGSIARLTTFDRGIVSPMYICFRTKDTLFPEYLDYYFETKQFFTEIQKRLEGSVRQCLSFEGLCNIPLCIPTIEVQQQVGKQLSTLVQEIKLEIDFLELLQRQKKFLLHQMFI
ncbi:restriction endonuclease subunit S, partial [Bacteroides xylanisolvens]|jgi:type I restriction enzyme S subunit